MEEIHGNPCNKNQPSIHHSPIFFWVERKVNPDESEWWTTGSIFPVKWMVWRKSSRWSFFRTLGLAWATLRPNQMGDDWTSTYPTYLSKHTKSVIPKNVRPTKKYTRHDVFLSGPFWRPVTHRPWCVSLCVSGTTMCATVSQRAPPLWRPTENWKTQTPIWISPNRCYWETPQFRKPSEHQNIIFWRVQTSSRLFSGVYIII